VQTAEGELEVEIAQVRQAAETFASKLFAMGTKLVRTEPLEALAIGAFVRGLSMREVASLCETAGLGEAVKTTASRVCEELSGRYEGFKRRGLYDTRLVALFLDATCLAVCPVGTVATHSLCTEERHWARTLWGATRPERRLIPLSTA
jgi:transposase-like protein